jgi:hypothetical protein
MIMKSDNTKHEFNHIPKIGKEKDTGKCFMIIDYIKHRDGSIEIVKDYDITDQMNDILNQQNKPVNNVISYSFPLTKWVKTATAAKQKNHFYSEWNEYLDAAAYEHDSQHELEELIDLYHSLETYFRILERDGIDVGAAFERVKQKNESRGYYAD